MLLSKGTMTGPDSAGRPNKSAEELAREGIGFQMSAFEWSATDVNRIQRIAVKESRLGIPVVFATDIIHGYWTVFPVPLGLAATFDPGRRAHRGRHLRARRLFARPALDLRAHGRSPGRSALGPRGRNFWRIAAGERATTPSRRCADFIGSLANLPGNPAPADFGVASCLKHYLGYGAVQGGKDYAYVDLTERSIREFHLPPFAAGIAAGAPSVMPAFTTGPGGVPMSANRRMLQDVLRGELGFDGVLVSDYAGITEMRNHGTAADDLEAAVQALRDGTMTVDMEDGVYYAQLARAVKAGRLRVDEIDREVLRALAFKRRLGLFEKPYVPEDLEKRVRLSDGTSRRGARDRAQIHRAAQERREAAAADGAQRILVTGPLADARDDLLGPWHARGEGEGRRERARRHPRARGDSARAPLTVSYRRRRGTRRQRQSGCRRRRSASPPRPRPPATAISSSPWSANANP